MSASKNFILQAQVFVLFCICLFFASSKLHLKFSQVRDVCEQKLSPSSSGFCAFFASKKKFSLKLHLKSSHVRDVYRQKFHPSNLAFDDFLIFIVSIIGKERHPSTSGFNIFPSLILLRFDRFSSSCSFIYMMFQVFTFSTFVV